MMNEPEKIVVRIKADGTTECKVSGVKGRSCTDLTKFLEQLGQATTEVTNEFYEEPGEERLEISLE